LPLRIGADSAGGNRFEGRIARVRVFDRALSGEEIARIAERGPEGAVLPPGCVVALDPGPSSNGGTAGSAVPNGAQARLAARIEGTVAIVEDPEAPGKKTLAFDGTGFLEIPHDPTLDFATGYLLDTYPWDSLRSIHRDPHLIYPAKLPLDRWTHVAATIDVASKRSALWVNGRLVAEAR
jgi:hypothetical protein